MEQVSIDQIKQEQKIFTDTWNLYKKYANISTEKDWEEFIQEADSIINSHKGYHKKFLKDMIMSVTNQLERNYKEKLERDKLK